MGKSRGAEAKLARLRSLRKESVCPAIVAELRKFLGDSSNLVAAEAAAIIGDANLADLAPEMTAAFDRFMVDPGVADKLCRAKIAIVEALNKIDYDRPEIFLRGIHHVQLEPVWGGSQDTAGALRGSAAFGLVRLNYRDVLALLVDLLADPEKVARVAAVQALAGTGSLTAVPLLRLKARVGDAEPEVTCECLTALLKLEPESVAFVAEFLRNGDEAIQEGAALALGETRRPGSFENLRDFSTDLPAGSLQDVVLLAIAMLRLPAAVNFLVELISRKDTARAAVAALAIHRHNERVRERVAAAVAQTKDAALQAWFEEKYDRP
ncbi:MAG TPA: HEAT repeat domain-containing protein [Gemmataceae bacterium]|nr:HEAT repeat domain-containing protein [Gemmataceae bacterium]